MIPISVNKARILVWTIPPRTERDDLAIPLSQSGTGIGQVLAILYVVLNSEYPRSIIIDEPQSFLHPGAIRKLFDILKQHKQHQYIITTHSPTVVTSVDPDTLLLVRKEETESNVEVIDVRNTQKQRLFLSEVGARLSDVFGADYILWVEGPTEELCLPIILSSLSKGEKALFGTLILGVIHTGDFEGKNSKTIFEIYSRLSEGAGLLPPAIGFIFDREQRSIKDIKDLERQSDGKVHFLGKRMFENYLLHPAAIASILTELRVRDKPIQTNEIKRWFENNKSNQKYFRSKSKDEDIWQKEVHGAKILKDIFSEFSDNRFSYNKKEHGLLLTKWLVNNAPEEFNHIYELIVKILDTGR